MLSVPEILAPKNPKEIFCEELFDNEENRYLYLSSVANDIYEMPVFTELMCRSLIDIAEKNGGWSMERHENYKTNDIEVTNLGLGKFFDTFIQKLLFPIFKRLWCLSDADNIKSENFIIKYELNGQKMLHLHHDDSDITMNVGLNSEYSGGEVLFPRQNLIYSNKKNGYGLIHPGKITHIHGSKQITFGVRYRLVSFIKFLD